MLSNPLPFLFLQAAFALLVRADLFITSPLPDTTCSGGKICTVNWVDDGIQPLLPAVGPCYVALYNGNMRLIQRIQPVDVSEQHSLDFTPDPNAGPNSIGYYINFTSVNPVNGIIYHQYSTMFTLDSMTGSFDKPIASDTSAISFSSSTSSSSASTSSLPPTSTSSSSASSTQSSFASASASPSSTESGTASVTGSSSSSATATSSESSSAGPVALNSSSTSTSESKTVLSVPPATNTGTRLSISSSVPVSTASRLPSDTDTASGSSATSPPSDTSAASRTLASISASAMLALAVVLTW